jgi:hypothetical protein
VADTSVTAPADTVRDAERARGERFALRRSLWRVSNVRRLRTCGRGVRDETVEILRVRAEDGTYRAAAHGLVTCSSVWACPVCAVHIRVQRAAELAAAVAIHRAAGGGLAFVTLTMRHGARDPLELLLRQLYGTWRKLQRRRDWTSRSGIRERIGLEGWVRAAEITYGVNGWHPHLHLLLFLESPLTEDGRADLHGWIESNWIATLRRAGGDALEGVAVTTQRVTDTSTSWEALAGYTTKGETLHHEIARGDRKGVRRRSSWSAWELLEAAADGEAWALRAWWEYERDTSGRRAIEWSRGLRDRLGLGLEVADEDVTDEALAALAAAEDVETVAVLTEPDWRAICAAHLDHQLLVRAANDGTPGVLEVLVAARRLRDRPPD